MQQKVHYLGYIVSAKEVATDSAKVSAIKKWEPSKDVNFLQAVLGTAGYYWQYMPDFATVAKPLTQLVSRDNA